VLRAPVKVNNFVFQILFSLKVGLLEILLGVISLSRKSLHAYTIKVSVVFRNALYLLAFLNIIIKGQHFPFFYHNFKTRTKN